MTMKRFDYVLNEFDEIEYITDIVDCEDRDLVDFLDYVNKMAEENEELKSIKRFAERNGINVFLIEEAFQRCWNDNGKLIKENERLEETNQELFDDLQNKTSWLSLRGGELAILKRENEQLKKDNEWLFKCIENQSAIIQELDSVIMAYNMEHKIIIKLTEKDLKTLDKALSYYTHQEVEE